MHITIRRYQIHPGSTSKLIEAIQEKFLPIIQKAPNFIGYYAIDEGDGNVSAVSLFEDEESALASNQLAANWILQNLSNLITMPPKITSGDVVASAGNVYANS
jgi:hypothetical protein